MPKKIKFIFVGKLKLKFWKDAEAYYLTRLKRYFDIQKIVVKDASGSLSIKDRIEKEGENILKKIDSKDFVITLDEKGELLTSMAFAKKLTKWMELPTKKPCFVIGGAYGVCEKVKYRSNYLFSLSSLTFTHELARAVLLEQVYRAYQIKIGSPYHH